MLGHALRFVSTHGRAFIFVSTHGRALISVSTHSRAFRLNPHGTLARYFSYNVRVSLVDRLFDCIGRQALVVMCWVQTVVMVFVC